LPSFSLEKILSSYDLESKRITKKIKKNDLKWITSSKKSKALIINVKYSDEVLY